MMSQLDYYLKACNRNTLFLALFALSLSCSAEVSSGTGGTGGATFGTGGYATTGGSTVVTTPPVGQTTIVQGALCPSNRAIARTAPSQASNFATRSATYRNASSARPIYKPARVTPAERSARTCRIWWVVPRKAINPKSSRRVSFFWSTEAPA
jgi:hypothetical protein